MDNKQDRNFYWNIKEFMSKPHNTVSPQTNTNSIKESINGVLNQNAMYKTTNFQSNITSANHISQAISAVERNNKKGTPDNIGNTKNITSNPFGMVNEGIFDDYGKAFMSGAKGVSDYVSNMFGSDEEPIAPGVQKPETTEQAQQNNINIRNASAKNLTPQQRSFEQSTSVPTTPVADSTNNTPKDQPTPSTTPATTPPPPPPPPPPSNTPTQPAAETEDSSGDDVSDKIAALRNARGLSVPSRTYRGANKSSNQSEVQSASRARNNAIRDANLALRSTPEGEKAFRQEKAKRSTTQGNIKQSDIALRYAKPGQRVADTQSPEETARIANEFVASQKEGRKPNYQATTPTPAGTIPTPAASEEQTQPGFDPSKKQVSNRDGTIRTINPTPAPAGTIPASTPTASTGTTPTPAPAPAGTIPTTPTSVASKEPTQPGFDPSKKQVSNRDGTIRTINPTPAPTQTPATTEEPAPGRAVDNLGMGSLPNNSGGLQNAEQPQAGFDSSKKQYSTKDGKIQTVNSKIAKITAAPKTALA
jgi:hypothetical protein